ncbi:MAG TPA: aldolase/citrate lyase family protein, partial [Steroidobacteraceae bacterium]|nr:aldolase/citrate lyase family protein [Steroidobacteraceae bacterium]
LDLVPLIETAAGLLGAMAIGQADDRVRRLAFGAADYTADIGVEWTPAEAELDHPRQMLVAASRAAGLEPPLDAPVLEFRDVERMRAAAARARAFGFQGKLCIHPAQIEPCHQAFAPTAEALARAARIVEAFEAAERSGIASIEVDGALVDYAVAVRARRVLASAG